MQIKKVAVLGAGLMGNQIAMQIALNGFETVCYSRREETVEKAKKYADGWFEKQVGREKLTQEAADATKAKLSFTTDLKQACTDADIVVETVADVLDIKRAVLAEADQYTPDHAI